MTKDTFFKLLTEEVKTYKDFLETSNNEWIVKGFIDIDKNVYTITNETKVVSKIIEFLLIPKLDKFARNHGMELELPSKQNYYPDLTFKDNEGHLFAVDFKSSYYNSDTVNGLTLGSYWGYFRNRDKKMSMDYTYNSYSAHIVLGMLYKQSDETANEKSVFGVDELEVIHSVIENFLFFVQPKWKKSFEKGTWDRVTSQENINEFNKSWLSTCRNILKEDGTIFVTGTYHNIFSVASCMVELGYKILNIIVWQKSDAKPTLSRNYFNFTTEYIVWARKNDNIPHFFNCDLMEQLNGGVRMSDVWHIPFLSSWELKCGKHPTPPLDFYTELFWLPHMKATPYLTHLQVAVLLGLQQTFSIVSLLESTKILTIYHMEFGVNMKLKIQISQTL